MSSKARKSSAGKNSFDPEDLRSMLAPIITSIQNLTEEVKYIKERTERIETRVNDVDSSGNEKFEGITSSILK